MKRLLLSLILLTTTIVGTLFILTHDVHAEDVTEVYEIPEDYKSRNYNVQFYRNTSDTTYRAYSMYTFDFTVYYQPNYDCVLSVAETHRDPGIYYDYYYKTGLIIYNSSNMYTFNLSQLDFDKNNVSKLTLTLSETEQINAYVKVNDCQNVESKKALNKELIENNSYTERVIEFSRLNNKTDGFYYGYGAWGGRETFYKMTVNDVFYYTESSQLYVCEKNPSTTSYYTHYSSITNETRKKAIDDITKWRLAYDGNVFPEPVLNTAKLNVAGDSIRLIYNYNHDITPLRAEPYNRIYVKLHNNNEWTTLSNTYNDNLIFTVAYNNTFKTITGGINLDILYASLGYDYYDETATLPVVDAVIWGTRYVYSANPNKYKNGYVNTSYIFSRYIFEENIIEDTDISVDDLGNLTDINSSNNSTSGGGGSVNVGGSESPTIEQIIIDNTSINSMSDFINSLKWDFSSISNAISSVFSLVVQFAGFIGNIFSALFGEPFFIIVLIAIGCAIILRVVGR